MLNEASCPDCALPLIKALRKGREQLVVEISFCPKCRFEKINGQTTEHILEVEPQYWLRVRIPKPVLALHVKAIRAADPKLANQAASQLMNDLVEKEEMLLGFFGRVQLDQDQAQAIVAKAGLVSAAGAY